VNVSGAAPAELVNDTIVDNQSVVGGGISSTGATAKVFNSILDGNQAAGLPQQAAGCYIGYGYVGPNTNAAAVTLDPGSVIRDTAGPPGFVNAAGSDYRLLPESQCVDSGAASWNGLSAPVVDLLGKTRPWDGSRPDLGAYEYQGPAGALDEIYVSKSGSDANRGTITQPKLTIQAGLNAVNSGGRVHVVAGNYTGDLSISKPVSLHSESGARAAYITGTGTDSVIKVTASASGVSIDGFIISGGKSPTNGGGIDLDSVGLATIENCTITANSAVGYGGGLYTYRAGLQLLDTWVTNNAAGLDGGGVYMYTDSPAAPSVVSGGQYLNNTARNGGAIAGRVGPITIRGITAKANTASAFGGAIDLDSVSQLILSGAFIQSNTAATGGGAVSLRNATSARCENNVLDSNRVTGAMGQGGGFSLGTGTIVLVNNTITRNRAYWGSASSWNDATVTVFNCIFWKNSSTKSQFSSPNGRTQPTPSYSYTDDASAKFNNNIGGAKTDPLFVNVTATATPNDDFGLQRGSICRNWGRESFEGVSAPLVDMGGRNRTFDPYCDLGAIEYPY